MCPKVVGRIEKCACQDRSWFCFESYVHVSVYASWKDELSLISKKSAKAHKVALGIRSFPNLSGLEMCPRCANHVMCMHGQHLAPEHCRSLGTLFVQGQVSKVWQVNHASC